MILSFQVTSTYQVFQLSTNISFNRLRLIKAYLNTNDMNAYNGILLFKINGLTDNRMYDSSVDIKNYNPYTFMLICPQNSIVAYDRLIDNYDYSSAIDHHANEIRIEVLNNDVNLTFGNSTKFIIEIEVA